ncbi:MAG: APC family permease [Thermoleophilia bacterium]
MATSVTGADAQHTTAIAEERVKLRKVLRRFDLVCFTIAAFIALDTIAATAAYGGGETLFWVGFIILLYMIPSGLICAELGSTFPIEGGPYAWPRMAFGRLAGALTATFYWMSNPTWMGGTLAATTVAVLTSGLMFNKPNGIATIWSILIGIAVVWAIVGLSIVELKWGRWTGNIGTLVRIACLAIFLVLVAWFLIKNGKPAGTITWGSLKPSITGFLAVIGLLQFLFVGFELSNSASEEMRNPQKDVPGMIVRSGLYSALIVLGLVFGILLVVPLSKVSNVSGFADAYDAVKSVLGGGAGPVGWLMGVMIIVILISAGGVWLQGAARTQAVAGLDGAAPLFLGKFSKSGTPIAMNILSAIIGSVFVILVFVLSSGSLESFFGVMLSLVISLTALQYSLIFPAIIVLRRKYPDRHRPYRLPGGALGMWVCVVATEFIVVLTSVSLLWPGLIDRLFGRSYDMQANWSTSRLFFESVTLGSLAAVIVLALVFYAIGKRNLARGIVGESDLLAVTTPAPATGPAPAAATPLEVVE